MLSERGRNALDSPIRKLAPLAEAAKQRGVKIYHLNIGQADFEAPMEFFEGLSLFQSRFLGYEASKGAPSLCEAWAEYYRKSCGVKLGAQNFVITNGASEALLYAMMMVGDPGDEILTFDPLYANNFGFANMAAVQLKAVNTTIDTGFLPDETLLASFITAKTKALLLCNPCNPTGALLDRNRFLSLLRFCDKHNLVLISDETYREIVFDGEKPFSLFELAPEHLNSIVVDSMSKRFSLCGARIGCFVSNNKDFVSSAQRMASSRLAVSSLEQFACAHLLRNVSSAYTQNLAAEFQARRDALCDSLSQIRGLIMHKPQGSFYLIVGLPLKDAEDFASFMLNDFTYRGASIFVAPAAGFYANSHAVKNQLRLAFVLKPEDLKEAALILSKGVEAYMENQADRG